MNKQLILIATSTLFLIISVHAQNEKGIETKVEALKLDVIHDVQSKYDQYKSIALTIWDYAELGYKEVKSASLHQQTLKDAGFTVEAGVADIPTAFVATYGSGKPIIGILAEYDALPGLSQTTAPEKQTAGKNAGHACGHHLFGTASVAAGIEIKKLIEEKKLSGTIKVYGCPAEEGGSGKVFMVRAGLFNDVDAVLHWHPSDKNLTTMASALAVKSAKFRFHGVSAHASAAPERGRSAVDAVEAMNSMVNMMREHTPTSARIHYVITNGGEAPNVVPDFAEVYYYVRHPGRGEVISIFDRVVKAAEGAAIGTETKMDYEVIGGTHDLLINKSLAAVMQNNLEKIGGVIYTTEETEYAKKIQSTFSFEPPHISHANFIQPLATAIVAGLASTDVGDVSYVVPTVGMRTATWVPGTAPHSWQAVACGGTDIGIKGMIVAAKTLALTAVDMFTTPAIVKAARQEFTNNLGDYQYKALLGERAPALDYRD